jgi:hypothetical protein
MKNINPSEDYYKKNASPFLISECTDFMRLNGETRLRTLAMTIPSHGHHQMLSVTQGCISATILAVQEFLSQVVSGLTLCNPGLPYYLVVSSSGLDAIDWLKRTNDTQHGWIPTYPVSGFITHGRLEVCPHFGNSPFEPAITLHVNRSGEPEFEDFTVEFSVADPEDMRILSLFMDESVDLWDEFEGIYGVTPFTSIPFPEEVERQFASAKSCREYVKEFVKHIVSMADGDECLETITLEFAVVGSDPLHEPIIASISLLNAFTLYKYSVETMDSDNSRAKALEEIKLANRIGQAIHQRDSLKE